MSSVPPLDVEAVFAVWRSRRPRPDLCRLTTDRRKLIASRLGLGYSAADLIAVIEYIHDADTDDAKWMRGQHPRNRTPYLDLDNLLRIQRLAGRVEAALLWKEQRDKGGTDTGDSDPFRIILPKGAA